MVRIYYLWHAVAVFFGWQFSVQPPVAAILSRPCNLSGHSKSHFEVFWSIASDLYFSRCDLVAAVQFQLPLQWWSPAHVRPRRSGIHRVIPGMRAWKTLKTAQLRHNMQKTSCDVPKNAYFPRSKHQLSGYFIETSRVQRLGILEITWMHSCP